MEVAKAIVAGHCFSGVSRRIALLTGILVLAGCSSDTESELWDQCVVDSDCPGRLVCGQIGDSFGKCVECDSDSQCPTGQVCSEQFKCIDKNIESGESSEFAHDADLLDQDSKEGDARDLNEDDMDNPEDTMDESLLEDEKEKCIPACAGKCAGASNGCGGLCPTDDCPNTCCGTVCCLSGQVCNPSGICCTPLTCHDYGYECGEQTDGCGGTQDCGSCEGENTFCNASGRCECLYLHCGTSCCARDQICYNDSCCTPSWHDTSPCNCTPTACAGCEGEKTQSDGCGNTRRVPCSLPPTGCAGSCCGGECCTSDQVCYGGSCCTPNCSGKCGGAADGCGGTCHSCPSGYVCQGTTCVHCGRLGEPCCDDDPECSAGGYACGPVSHTCRRMGRIKVYTYDPGGGGCPDSDYIQVGRWRTQPYSVGGDEAKDSIDNQAIDRGWVVLCAVGDGGGAYVTYDDRTGQSYSCPNGWKAVGKWHVSSSSGEVSAVGAAGRQLRSGWLTICVDPSLLVKVEVGWDECNNSGGPGCGPWTRIGEWHVGFNCNDGVTGCGPGGGCISMGWMRLCIN